MVNIETVPLVLAACTYHLEAVACVLHVLCALGARLVGILGNLDDRTCKFQETLNPVTDRTCRFQEKLNPVTACRIKIFEACLVTNVCLHLRCSNRKDLYLFLLWLTYLPWIYEKKMERKTQWERIRSVFLFSLSCCQTRPSVLEVGLPMLVYHSVSLGLVIEGPRSILQSWLCALASFLGNQFFDSYLNVWIMYEWECSTKSSTRRVLTTGSV